MRLRPFLSAALAVALAAGAAACQDDITTEFPDGLEPLEDNHVPELTGASPLEQLVTLRGEDGYKWVDGRGVILAPPGVVWAATKVPERMVDSCNTDRQTITVGPEPQYEYGFKVHYEVDEVVTVEWDELWRYGTITGTPSDPSLAMIRYQKVFGSDFITTLEGSIEIVARPDPDQTEIQMIEHLDAFGGTADQMESALKQQFALLVAAVHGNPPPSCP
ncbi:MAG TPA: hypothetical protein VHE35_04825 [Kofleriaceae bacterium]|nr:hypothetical protein [Kofleriaceae bacterium]